MDNQIKSFLETTFGIEFSVQQVYGDFEEYEIKPNYNSNEIFVIRVILKENVRITIECEPDVYGKNFLDNINNSTIEQRKVFAEYWEKLGERWFTLNINNRVYSIEEFLNDTEKWNSFILRFSKNAYYDEEKEKREEAIIHYIELLVSMILSITSYEIEGIEQEALFEENIEYLGRKEGTLIERKSKTYERNPINRNLCLLAKGYKCSICGFDFEEVYGEIGKKFIEVHHIIPVSTMGNNYVVDPIKELFPLCSNCHSMVHRKNPPYTIEEVKDFIYRRSNG